MSTDRADHLIPRGWRWRITARRHDDGRIELVHPVTGDRLAWVVPERGFGGAAKSWVVADANMVTRWHTRLDAVLYAAQPRGRWDRPWPWKTAQFRGDLLRNPGLILANLVRLAATAAAFLAYRPLGDLVAVLAATGVYAIVSLAVGWLPLDEPEPDYRNGDDGEIDGWPDDPRWRALFDTTVWAPGYREDAITEPEAQP